MGLFTSSETYTHRLLKKAHITINGNNPWDMQVHNKQLFDRVLAKGSLGLGQAFMDGWWDCEELDTFFYLILSSKLEQSVEPTLSLLYNYLKAKCINFQSPSRAFEIGAHHYDLSNTLYQAMLDQRMVYTCGYWDDAKSLDAAQTEKLDLACKKLQLEPGMRVLDIGCGWGSFLKFAAENYGVQGVGVTVSQEQVTLGTRLCRGLPVDIRFEDYRSVNETFDRIVSLGMFEHVGYKNYRTFMELTNRCLADDGLFLLHTIGANESTTTGDPWIMKYIFPNSMLPSIAQIGQASEGLFVMEDWHNFGPSYDKTLLAWHNNFIAAWPTLEHDFSQRFYRMWRYFLLSCAGAFRARKLQLWQIVLSKHGLKPGYRSIR